MKNLFRCLIVAWAVGSVGWAQNVVRDLRYAESPHERHVLDVFAPTGAKDLPVVFWVHGGGWLLRMEVGGFGDEDTVQTRSCGLATKISVQPALSPVRPTNASTAAFGEISLHPNSEV